MTPCRRCKGAGSPAPLRMICPDCVGTGVQPNIRGLRELPLVLDLMAVDLFSTPNDLLEAPAVAKTIQELAEDIRALLAGGELPDGEE